MGIFSGLRKAGSYIFNFRVDQWISYDFLKQNTESLVKTSKQVFTIDQATHTETFEEAMLRLGITEQDLKDRIREFRRLLIFWCCAGFLIFFYGCYLGLYGFISAFLISLALTCYSGVQAFRYHFWIFQIQQKKLGCSIQEWLDSKTLPTPNSESHSDPNSNSKINPPPPP